MKKMTLIKCFSVFFFIAFLVSCSTYESQTYNLYVLNDNSKVVHDYGNYLDLYSSDDTLSYFKPSHNKFIVPYESSLHEDSIICDTVHYDSLLMEKIYWKVNVNEILYSVHGNEVHTLPLVTGDSSIAKFIPFYFKPYVGYGSILNVNRKSKGGTGVIYAINKGIIKIKVENKMMKVKVYKIHFNYNDFGFGTLKPDIMYIDCKSFLPVRFEYKGIPNLNKSDTFIQYKIEINHKNTKSNCEYC